MAIIIKGLIIITKEKVYPFRLFNIHTPDTSLVLTEAASRVFVPVYLLHITHSDVVLIQTFVTRRRPINKCNIYVRKNTSLSLFSSTYKSHQYIHILHHNYCLPHILPKITKNDNPCLRYPINVFNLLYNVRQYTSYPPGNSYRRSILDE